MCAAEDEASERLWLTYWQSAIQDLDYVASFSIRLPIFSGDQTSSFVQQLCYFKLMLG